MKKKIVIISNSVWNIENFRKNLILKLLNLDNKLYIIAPRSKNKEISILHKNLSILYLNFKPNSYLSFIDLLFIFKYIFFIIKIKPHYVFSFTVKPNLICSYLSKFLNYKSICNITGLGTLFLRGILVERVACYMYKKCLKNAYHSFFHNINDKKIFLEKKIINFTTSSIIPGSGVNLDLFKFTEKNYSDNQEINFLYLGRIIKDKGINEYLYAIEKIKNNYSNVNFIFVGKINNNNKELTNLFTSFVKKKYIIYKDEVLDVRDELINCDCVVLPSYREGLSKSLLEASVIGRPMLVSDVPGCNDVVKDGFNGLLFKSKNYKSLYNSLIKFMKLPSSEKKIMAKNAYSQSFMYDEKIIINKYTEFLK